MGSPRRRDCPRYRHPEVALIEIMIGRLIELVNWPGAGASEETARRTERESEPARLGAAGERTWRVARR